MPICNRTPYSGRNALSTLLNAWDYSFVGETVVLLTYLCGFTVAEGYEDELGFHFTSAQSNDTSASVDLPEWLGEHI